MFVQIRTGRESRERCQILSCIRLWVLIEDSHNTQRKPFHTIPTSSKFIISIEIFFVKQGLCCKHDGVALPKSTSIVLTQYGISDSVSYQKLFRFLREINSILPRAKWGVLLGWK